MKRKTASALAALSLAIFLVAGAPRAIQANTFESVSRASGNLLSVSQQITQFTLLVALNVNKAENLAKLGQQAQLLVDRVGVLRAGDPNSGLSGQWPAALDAQLSHIQKLSGDLAQIVNQSLKARTISPEQVQAVAGIEASLRQSLESFQKQYRDLSPNGEVYSLYLNTMDVARQQAVLSQKMFKEFLYVAFNLSTTDSQRSLNRSYSLLDRSFQALIYGDSELQLIPAPNQQVERHWNDARSIWIGFRPMIKQVARDGAVVDVAMITAVAEQNEALLTAMNSAVAAY